MSSNPNPALQEIIQDWPYHETSQEFYSFRQRYRRDPAMLWIGEDLWMVLRKVFPDSPDLFFNQTVPIRRDFLGILEGHEFIFTRE
jgi:hypothetical protein